MKWTRERRNQDVNPGAGTYRVDKSFGNIGLKAKFLGILYLENGLSGGRKITRVGKLSDHDSVERRADLDIAEHRLGLSQGGFGNAEARLDRIEFLTRGDLFLEQVSETLVITLSLIPVSNRPIILGLYFLGINLGKKLILGDPLAEIDMHLGNPSGNLGLDAGHGLRPHRSDNLLKNGAGFAFRHNALHERPL